MVEHLRKHRRWGSRIGILVASLLFIVSLIMIQLWVPEPEHIKYLSSYQLTKYVGFSLEEFPDVLDVIQQRKKNVFLLHSYHKGIPWTDTITMGIEDELREQNIYYELYVEYMDTKRYPDMVTNPAFVQELRDKYTGDFTFDVIIACDNDALDFLKANKDDLFPDVPVVFCGVSGLTLEDCKKLEGITGIMEKNDVKGTLKAALALNPEVKKCYIVNDTTTTGKAIRLELEADFDSYNLPLDYEFLQDYSMKQLLEKVASLSDDSVVLLMSWTMDTEGTYYSYIETGILLSQNSAVPVYSIWDVFIGHGLIGGSMSIGYYLGEDVAEMAVEIINGKDVSEIPSVISDSEKYIFDYRQLRRFGLDRKKLPDGSLLMNYPYNLFVYHPKLMLSTLAILTFLFVVIVILTVNVNLRERVQQHLSQNQVRLKDTVRELASKNEELESIIYASHHDLRTPMVNINGFSYELEESLHKLKEILSDVTIYSSHKQSLDEILDMEINQEVEQITRNARRIFDLQTCLLEVSLIGQKALHRERIDMNELVQSLLDGFHEIRKGQVKVFAYPLPDVTGDRKMLKKAFHNLVENSLNFRSGIHEPEISISGSQDENFVYYHITDNGIGIAELNFQDIFQLFYKVDPVKYPKGMGLGLTIVKRIVSRHNGFVDVTSDIGQGATFTIKLPIRRSKA